MSVYKNLMLAVLAAAIAVMSTSCGSVGTYSAAVSSSAGSSATAYFGTSISKSEQTDAALNSPAEIGSTSSYGITDITAEAKKLNTTPGQVALAIIINRLDGATVVEDMSKRSAQELFDLLRQTATQNSRTLEGLNKQYYLSDILASDGIYVVIQANNVISSSSGSFDKNWIKKFEKALVQ